MNKITRNRNSPTDTKIERLIVIGLITSKRFIQEIIGIYKPGVLRGTFAASVAEWVIDYYNHYQDAPGKTIEDIFREQKIKGLLEDDSAEAIEESLIKAGAIKINSIEEEPIAFGLKALIAFFAWPEKKETGEAEEAIKSVKDVSSLEVIDYRRAFG